MEGGSTSWHLVLRWNYVNLSAWLTTIVLCVLSGERGGALGTQHSCCEVVALFCFRGFGWGLGSGGWFLVKSGRFFLHIFFSLACHVAFFYSSCVL